MPCSRRRCSMTATTPSTASRRISPSAESGCGDDRPQHRPDAGPRGQVVVEGWRTATGTPVLGRIRELAPVVGGFLFTQVEKEGAMSGFDFQAVAAAVRAAGKGEGGARLTAAGGITTATEIAEL